MRIKNPSFRNGYTPIIEMKALPWTDPANPQMDFGILRLDSGQNYIMNQPLEKSVLLMTGSILLKWNGQEKQIRRGSLFDENPTALLVPKSVTIQIIAREPSELCLVQTKNDLEYPPRYFPPEECLTQRFGEGTLRETSTRNVRTIYDKNNMPDSNLVLGEVINYPGKWSSYPPHGHNQPEIYHYRFLPEQGFGFGMDGEDSVNLLKNGDSLLIQHKAPHSQTAAPGYAMYYIWAIRHLDGDPYGPKDPRKFQPEHVWVMDPKNDDKIWPFPKSS
jgi:5-deoxy-glucuronate isomerase